VRTDEQYLIDVTEAIHASLDDIRILLLALLISSDGKSGASRMLALAKDMIAGNELP